MVPETLEPSLQLASAVLSQLNMPQDEVAHAIQAFRRNHVSELQVTHPTLHTVCLSSCAVPCDGHICCDDDAFKGLALSCAMQVLCRNSGSTLGYGFATLMEDADDSSSEEDEPLRPMSLTEAVP